MREKELSCTRSACIDYVNKSLFKFIDLLLKVCACACVYYLPEPDVKGTHIGLFFFFLYVRRCKFGYALCFFFFILRLFFKELICTLEEKKIASFFLFSEVTTKIFLNTCYVVERENERRTCYLFKVYIYIRRFGNKECLPSHDYMYEPHGTVQRIRIGIGPKTSTKKKKKRGGRTCSASTFSCTRGIIHIYICT